MTQKQLKKFVRVIFSVSFIFIFTGIYLDYVERKTFIDPLNGVININDYNKVTISTIEGDNDNSSLIDSNIEDISDNGLESEFSSDLSSIVSINNLLREKIEDTYGIEVKYGSETDEYTVSRMSVVSMTDQVKIQKALNQLNSILMLYPNDFFKEFSEENLSLRIYLVQRYSTVNVTGITELTGDVTTISIAMDYDFAESFHHEIYHYIEHFIERKSGKFSIWNTYNPNGFIYGEKAKSNLSFNRTSSPSSPFVNNYAQTNADEDRASTFEYMTTGFKPSCFNSNEYPIWKKASYMSLMIDTYFDTVSPNVIDYWERFI